MHLFKSQRAFSTFQQMLLGLVTAEQKERERDDDEMKRLEDVKGQRKH